MSSRMVVAPAMPPPITATDVVAGSTVLSPARVRCEFVGGNASQNIFLKTCRDVIYIYIYFIFLLPSAFIASPLSSAPVAAGNAIPMQSTKASLVTKCKKRAI